MIDRLRAHLKKIIMSTYFVLIGALNIFNRVGVRRDWGRGAGGATIYPLLHAPAPTIRLFKTCELTKERNKSTVTS